MNMMLTLSPCASYAEFNVNVESIEVDEDQNVYFTLEHDDQSIDVTMKAAGSTSRCFEYGSSCDPENSQDVDFDCLYVDDFSFGVVTNYENLTMNTGQILKLTSRQAQYINGFLDEVCMDLKIAQIKQDQELAYEY